MPRKKYAAILEDTGIFTPEEADAILKEYRLHERDGVRYRHFPRIDSTLPQKLIEAWLINGAAWHDGTTYTGAICLNGEEREAYASAHQKARKHIPELWDNVCDDVYLLAHLSGNERVMIHLVYDIPQERLGLDIRGPESSEAA